MSPLDQLKRQLTELSPEQRVEISDWLNHQIDEDHGTPEEIEAAWLEEIERRAKEMEDGTADMVPMEEVFAKWERRLGSKS